MSTFLLFINMLANKIIVHHSLTKDSGTVSWGAIRRYHIEQLGLEDIGYHAGVELVTNQDISYYEVLLGRRWNKEGAHTRGHNRDSLGICFIGNFDDEPPSLDQLTVGAKLIQYWMDLFGIPLSRIYPHRHFAAKSCPGKRFDMNVLLDIIRMVE